jgi:Uma2 family endonuclease
MSTRPQRQYTPTDYFLIEAGSPIRHEFFNGEIFAMPGGTVAHNQVCANVLALLSVGFGTAPCRALGSDMRLATPRGLLTYPEVMVICGRVELFEGREDTVTNPVVLVEVLSDATRNYDRGDKFVLYQAIPTLRDYLLIEPREVRIEHYRRAANDSWPVLTYGTPGQLIELTSIPARLPVAEIYRKVLDALQ